MRARVFGLLTATIISPILPHFREGSDGSVHAVGTSPTTTGDRARLRSTTATADQPALTSRAQRGWDDAHIILAQCHPGLMRVPEPAPVDQDSQAPNFVEITVRRVIDEDRWILHVPLQVMNDRQLRIFS